MTRPHIKALAIQTSTEGASEDSSAIAGPISVLLIEDDPDAAALIQALLNRRAGYKIETAGRLWSGLEQLLSKHYDVVIADLNLPDSEGLATLKGLKGWDPEMPVVILTAEEGDETAMGALTAGARDFLVKSRCDGDSLVRAIRHAISRR